MTQRCLRALARVLMVVAALATTAGVAALSAQSTGKIEGHIKDPQGAPIPNARVFIPGTSFNAPVNPQGYYFIENIPAGTVSVRATYVGYQPLQKDGVRVLSGQTLTLDFTLQAAPVALQDIVVRTSAQNALVPARRGRDQADHHRRHGAEAAGRSHPAGAGAAAGRGAGEHLRQQPAVQPDHLGARRPRRPERHVHRRCSGAERHSHRNCDVAGRRASATPPARRFSRSRPTASRTRRSRPAPRRPPSATPRPASSTSRPAPAATS